MRFLPICRDYGRCLSLTPPGTGRTGIHHGVVCSPDCERPLIICWNFARVGSIRAAYSRRIHPLLFGENPNAQTVGCYLVVAGGNAGRLRPRTGSRPGAGNPPKSRLPRKRRWKWVLQACRWLNPMAVTGDIIIAGSSTVYPLAERMAERFVDEGYDGSISISSIGSGAGFERFCVAGETDVSNASRPIKDSEVESCNAIERAPIELRVGTDALAVVVSQENDFLTDISMEELAQIFSTATNWSDVNADWPSEPIQRFSPGTDSGTFDYFVEEVFDKDAEPILASAELQLSEDDNVLVQGVLGSAYAIGYFGYAYYQENADTLKVLSINGVGSHRRQRGQRLLPVGQAAVHVFDRRHSQ